MAINHFEIYRIDPGWYFREPSGIHGMGHAARVLIWANRIAEWMLSLGQSVDIEAARWAAVLHDIRRENDGWDAGHGKRAGIWLNNNSPKLPIAFSPLLLSKVVFACSFHDVCDEQISKWAPELLCLKDADGLDRVRIQDLNPSFLRTKCARATVDLAQELFGQGNPKETTSWDAVFKQAKRMKLLE
jgi:HD superfamily phosphodiesterase